jgi:hypothetical protein
MRTLGNGAVTVLLGAAMATVVCPTAWAEATLEEELAKTSAGRPTAASPVTPRPATTTVRPPARPAPTSRPATTAHRPAPLPALTPRPAPRPLSPPRPAVVPWPAPRPTPVTLRQSVRPVRITHPNVGPIVGVPAKPQSPPRAPLGVHTVRHTAVGPIRTVAMPQGVGVHNAAGILTSGARPLVIRTQAGPARGGRGTTAAVGAVPLGASGSALTPQQLQQLISAANRPLETNQPLAASGSAWTPQPLQQLVLQANQPLGASQSAAPDNTRPYSDDALPLQGSPLSQANNSPMSFLDSPSGWFTQGSAQSPYNSGQPPSDEAYTNFLGALLEYGASSQGPGGPQGPGVIPDEGVVEGD